MIVKLILLLCFLFLSNTQDTHPRSSIRLLKSNDGMSKVLEESIRKSSLICATLCLRNSACGGYIYKKPKCTLLQSNEFGDATGAEVNEEYNKIKEINYKKLPIHPKARTYTLPWSISPNGFLKATGTATSDLRIYLSDGKHFSDNSRHFLGATVFGNGTCISWEFFNQYHDDDFSCPNILVSTPFTLIMKIFDNETMVNTIATYTSSKAFNKAYDFKELKMSKKWNVPTIQIVFY